MIPTQELLLVLAAFALYAADATWFLYADELALEKRGRRWVVHEGTPFLLAGKRPVVPHLLRPAGPLLRVSVGGLAGHGPAPDGHRVLAALRPFGWAVTALFLLFFPGLPLVLRGSGAGAGLLAWVVAVYGVVGAMAWLAWRRRGVLGLRRRAWLALVLEGLVCPPLAINLVRKLGARGDLVSLDNATRLLGSEGHSRLVAAATHRIDEMLDCLEAGASGATRLHQQRLQLAARPHSAGGLPRT